MRTLAQVRDEARRAIEAAAPYAAAFEETAAALPGANLPWAKAMRRRAIEKVRAEGLPTGAIEDWKYTDLKALRDLSLGPSAATPSLSADDIAPFKLKAEALTLVFEDGRFRADLSDLEQQQAGVEIGSLALHLKAPPAWLEAALLDGAEAHALAALNTALMTDGATIRIARGVVAEKPIHILHLTTKAAAGAAHHLRHLIRLEAGARVSLLESYAGLGAASAFTNVLTGVSLGKDAALVLVKLQTEGAGITHLARTAVTAAEGAEVQTFILSVGAALQRNEIAVRLEGARSRADLSGVTFARNEEALDHVTLVDHVAGNAESSQLYKTVLGGRARSAYLGRVIVRQGAQRTDARQAAHALLLSDGAEAIAKPELEILADDVKCGHGATVGEIDLNQLFYMKARGIPEDAARALLIEAFLAEPIERIGLASLKEHVRAALAQATGGAEGALP